MKRSFPIKYEWDIVTIRKEVRKLANEHGFSELNQARIVQSVSELASNVVHHAEEGRVQVELIEEENRSGINIIVRDFGPGIDDLDQILRLSESPASVEGYGLKQVRELMDEFSIRAVEGKGTYVSVSKWKDESDDVFSE
ncbi:serine/threonine-protein kinase RsbT [Marininema mesophilum]|uniref:Serine/threonine-protein kinase RsbT n=1 Tax=Marininema mesophilum TaxID=1048340 RepID=A0A1H2WHE1_9BACL|nr:anti-sigma regulatory factor [Marininema mesophilum]SDW79674.1 serine/threonine-protein kinase RsbT [Marininema mesophilum]